MTKEFAILAMGRLKKLMDDAEMLVDVKAYDAAKGRLERGEDEQIPLEITERRSAGESASKTAASTAWISRSRRWSSTIRTTAANRTLRERRRALADHRLG